MFKKTGEVSLFFNHSVFKSTEIFELSNDEVLYKFFKDESTHATENLVFHIYMRNDLNFFNKSFKYPLGVQNCNVR